MADNIAVLTQSHSAIATKKRARRAQIKEVVFDEEARRWVPFVPMAHATNRRQIVLDGVPQTQGRTTRACKEKSTAQREAGETRDAARGPIPFFTRSCFSSRRSIVAPSRNGRHGMLPKLKGHMGLLQVRKRDSAHPVLIVHEQMAMGTSGTAWAADTRRWRKSMRERSSWRR